jgi:glycerol-3-phosphate acyltransferase PlsX
MVEKSPRGKFGLWLAKPVLKKVFKDKLDPSAYGGAPLLGLGHIAIKCHGSSSGRAVMNGIRVAQKFVDESVMQKLSAALSSLDVKEGAVVDDSGNSWSRVFEKKARGRDRAPKGSTGGSHE